MNPLPPGVGAAGCCGLRPKKPPVSTPSPARPTGGNFSEVRLFNDEPEEPLLPASFSRGSSLRVPSASAAPAPADEDEDEEVSAAATELKSDSRARGGASVAPRSFFAPSSSAAGRQTVSVVQGASGGIGLELTRQLLERRDLRSRSGGVVVATCRNPDACEGLQELRARHGDRLLLLPLDVLDSASANSAARAVAEIFPAVHLLVNCSGILHGAGLAPETSLAGLTAEAGLRTYAVNALGPMLVLSAFTPLLRAAAAQRPALAPAVAANLSARVGSMRENRLGGWHAYRASKAALNSLTRTVAVEHGREGSGVICLLLHPGTVDTALSRPFNRNVPPKMLFSPEAAVRCLLDVVGRAQPEHNGQFLSWDGTQIDW